MNNLITRLLTGILFLAILITSILWSFWSFLLIFLLITVLSLWEFFSLLEKDKVRVNKPLVITTGVVFYILCSSVALNIAPYQILLLVFPLLVLVFIFEL